MTIDASLKENSERSSTQSPKSTLATTTSKNLPPPSSRKKPHGRTQSIAAQPVTQKKKQHDRRGSLPAIHVLDENKYMLFDSPTRSSFLHSSIPLSPKLPEKGAISIQIANPKSDVAASHYITTRHGNTIRNLSYIVVWYFFSTSLSLYNKNLMGKDRFNFNFPLLVSAIHSGLHSVLTAMIMWLGGNKWRSSTSISLKDYFYKVVPCGIAAAVEICCSNASLVYITLSFYTMVKSSTPIWMLLFSFLFGFEKPKFLLVVIIAVMVTGVILTVEGETKFDGIGFTLVLVGSIVSGLRWNMTQLLLQHESLGISNPIATLYYLSPIMFVIMLSLSLIYENPFQQFQHSKHFDTISHFTESLMLMLIGGFLAFAMTLAELSLIKSTNTVTLSVAGISKEIVIIGLSVLLYGDVLTSKSMLGLCVSIIGIITYNYYKLSKHHNPEKGQYQIIPLHSTSNNSRNLRD